MWELDHFRSLLLADDFVRRFQTLRGDVLLQTGLCKGFEDHAVANCRMKLGKGRPVENDLTDTYAARGRCTCRGICFVFDEHVLVGHLRLLPDVVLIRRGDVTETHEGLLNILVIFALKIRQKFQPDPVARIDRFVVGMIRDRIEPLFFAVGFDFVPVNIEQRPDDTDTALISFIGDACQTVGSRPAQKPEEDRLRLIVGILCDRDLDRGGSVCIQNLHGGIIERIVSGFASCFFAGHSRGGCQRIAIDREALAFEAP